MLFLQLNYCCDFHDRACVACIAALHMRDIFSLVPSVYLRIAPLASRIRPTNVSVGVPVSMMEK